MEFEQVGQEEWRYAQNGNGRAYLLLPLGLVYFLGNIIDDSTEKSQARSGVLFCSNLDI